MKDDQITGDQDSETISPEPVPARADRSDAIHIGTEGTVPAHAVRNDGESRRVPRERDLAASQASFFDRAGQFIRETRAEMRRVSWPSFTEVRNTTIITLVAVIFFAIYLFAVDQAWAFVIAQIERLAVLVRG